LPSREANNEGAYIAYWYYWRSASETRQVPGHRLHSHLLPWPLAQAVNQNSNRQIGEGITLNHPGSLNRLFGRCTTHRVNISALTPRSANTWGGLLPGARIKVRDMKSFRTLGPFHETSTLKVHSGSPRSSPQHEVGPGRKGW
jgi:hypothetical protein